MSEHLEQLPYDFVQALFDIYTLPPYFQQRRHKLSRLTERALKTNDQFFIKKINNKKKTLAEMVHIYIFYLYSFPLSYTEKQPMLHRIRKIQYLHCIIKNKKKTTFFACFIIICIYIRICFIRMEHFTYIKHQYIYIRPLTCLII